MKRAVSVLHRAAKRDLGVTLGDYMEEARQAGLTSLRAKQFEMAMQGDKTMLVWLGKQYLGQTDKRHLEQDITQQTMGQIKIYIPDNGREPNK